MTLLLGGSQLHHRHALDFAGRAGGAVRAYSASAGAKTGRATSRSRGLQDGQEKEISEETW